MAIPVLPPRLMEFIAVNVAPPENAIVEIAAQFIVGAPEATDIVATAPSILLDVIKNPLLTEEPAQLKALVIVIVAPLPARSQRGAVRFNVAIVGEPDVCIAAKVAPVFARLTIL